MIDNITLYTIIFYSSLALPIFFIFLLSEFYSVEREKLFYNYFVPIYLLFVVLLIGLRPIGPNGFTDTQMYIQWFEKSKNMNIIPSKDLGFGFLIWISSKIFTIRVFFIICVLLSFGTLYWVSIQVNRRYWFLFFLGTMVSLYFWNHQVFTLRQGIASVVFLAGLFRKKLFFRFFLFLIAISFHKSFLLPVLCFIVVSFFNKTNFYLLLWFISVPISYFFGNEIGKFCFAIFPEDIRYYYVMQPSDQINFMGFRWGVVFYSLVFIIFPYYYKCNDSNYKKIFNLYLLTNIFTIFIIWSAGGFIHRFAYLSWFLTPLLVYYPLLTRKLNFTYKPYLKVITGFYVFILVYLGVKLYKHDFKFVSTDQTITQLIEK